MAIKDVREYYYTMLSQYIEEKQNLADFEEALKNGLITEAQMNEALEIVAGLEENYHRLAYIMYLLNKPNRKEKKKVYARQYKNILDEFIRLNADAKSVKKENEDALLLFKAKLKKLSEKGE